MKTVGIALLAGLIILAQFSTTYAETGNSLLERWRAFERWQTRQSRDKDIVDASAFVGYVTAIRDSFFPHMPLPPGVTGNQILGIVGKYLESHPEELHEAGPVLVVRALWSVFPQTK